MSDSILINILLNEDNAIQHMWLIYTILAVITGVYSIWYNILKAIVYAGITFELVLRFFKFFVESMLDWAAQRRNHLVVAF
jgi:hypothetical protein